MTDQVAGQAAAAVAAVVDRVFAVCDALAAAYVDLCASVPGPPRSADLAPLRDVVVDLLAGRPEVMGLGAVVAPDLLADRDRWLEWYERGPHGLSRLLLDLDPAGEDFYDYPRMHWFAVPRDERRRAVSGPYVDFRGANRYVYTFASPAVGPDGFLGVGGADAAVELVEPLLLQALEPLDGDALVVTADRRVVVATTGRWTPGARLRSLPEPGPGWSAVVPVTDDLGWLLAVADS